MASNSQNCSPKPIFKGLTHLFLRAFGTNELPAGYVKHDEYGPKTKNEEFAALFTTFYILIVLAVLCVLAFLLMVTVLLWYCNRKKFKSEPYKNQKLWTRLLTLLLLLSLILLALFLFTTFKNLLQLNKLYNKSHNESSAENDSMMESVNDILFKDFKDVTFAAMLDCKQSIFLTDVYPETTKLRKFSTANNKLFENFIETSINPIFENILLYDDLFRTFSRNFSAFVGSSRSGQSYVIDMKSSYYNNAIFSLYEWGSLYQSSIAIKELMNLYKESARSDERRLRVCNEIAKYFIELNSYVKAQRTYLAGKIRSYDLSRDPVVAPPYIFGHIVCIMAIVVLVLFFLFLMCALCMKGSNMIKALLFIFIILTLLLILVAFVSFYHFFYGVIEYNGLCKMGKSSAGNDNFNHVILTECTNDQNLYTLLLENNLILPFSEWTNLNTANILDVCKKTCRPLNTTALQDLRPKIDKYPMKYQFCKFKPITSTWLIYIRLVHMTYDSIFSASWMVNRNPTDTYYYNRINSSHCLLDLATKATTFQPTFNKAKYLKCRAGYKVGRDFVLLIRNSNNEVTAMCETAIQRCTYFTNQGIPSIIDKITKYKKNAEKRLKNVLGSCANILPMVTTQRKKSCDCETYILNGVWVGSLLFVLTLFLALLLLAYLIWKLERSRKRHDVESILLPTITLPRRVIDTIEHDENPGVTYHVKKLN